MFACAESLTITIPGLAVEGEPVLLKPPIKQQEQLHAATESGGQNHDEFKQLRFDVVDCSLGSKYLRLKLSVTNAGDVPVTVDGTKSQLRSANQTIASALTSEQMVARKQKASKTLASFVTAATTVGTVETLQEIKEQKGDVLKRYEGDEKERGLTESMFGKTLLYPGTNNSGYVYFPKSGSGQKVYFRCPLETFYAPKYNEFADVQIGTQTSSASVERK